MFVNRSALLAAGVLCLGFSGRTALAQSKPSDWKPTKFNPVTLVQKTERMFKGFKKVAGGVLLHYKAPDPSEDKGYGTGRAAMNEYFWSDKKFRLQYLVYGPPNTEYLASNGAGQIKRLGSRVGPKNTIYSPRQGIFDVASDGQLVERWPMYFPKYLFSSFVGGNATLSRYVKALVKGVGGYSVSMSTRQQQYQGNTLVHYRIYASRPARANRPKSTVEMIFDANLSLPVTINTSYGDKWDLKWTTRWYNNVKFPHDDPFIIDQ